MTRTLIFGTSYIADYARRNVVDLWARVTAKLNPDTDISLIDSASPIRPESFLSSRIQIFQFGDNVGHLNITGKDGWGRAFCKGIELAISGGYDYVAHIDSDMLFARSASQIVAKIARTGVKVACPMAHPYLFAETACLFASVPYLKEIDFVKQYDWEHPAGKPIPEVRCEQIFGDDLFGLPLKGIRNDGNAVTWLNFDHRAAAYGLDFFTHSADFGLYERFLRLNGIRL